MDRPFRFGIPLFHEGDAGELAAEAHAAEELGYATLQAFDQLALVPSSPVPALAYAAAVTSTIGLSSYVFDNGYRHPVVLAKEAAVLDRLCDGRLELGLGAGYSEDEYRGSGLSFSSGATRMARLEEAVAILKALFREGTASHDGTHYRVSGFKLPVTPLQRPWPRLLVGGARRMMLEFAAREAQIVSLAVTSWDPRADGGPGLDATRRKLAWVREAAAARWDELEIEILVNVRFGASRSAALAEASARTGSPAETLAASPHLVAGTPEEIAETLRERRRDLGISYFSVRPLRRLREFAEVIRLLS